MVASLSVVVALCGIGGLDGRGSALAGEGCGGLRMHLETWLQRSSWPAETWSAESLGTHRWRKSARAVSLSGSRFVGSIASDSVDYWSGPARLDWEGNPTDEYAQECSTTVYRRFHVDGDTLSFTAGNVCESCSETPRALWRTADGRPHRRLLAALYNWNVEALWCTGRYLVFGLEDPACEGGDRVSGLAFWQPDTGRWWFTPQWIAYAGQTMRFSDVLDLSRELPGWQHGEVAESNGAFLIRVRSRALAFWPERWEWARVAIR